MSDADEEVASRVRNLTSAASIRHAYQQAAKHVDKAMDEVLAARRQLLAAGFGDDHPSCRALDAHAEALAHEFRDLRRATT